MRHSGEFDRDPYRRGAHGDAFERAGGRFMEFLRSRTAEHWLMFAAGVVVGMILG